MQIEIEIQGLDKAKEIFKELEKFTSPEEQKKVMHTIGNMAYNSIAESFENKNINEIFKEYSKNPYYMAKRGITYVLAHAFGIIPVVTDNPDYIRMLKVKKEKELAEAEAAAMGESA